MANKPAPQHPGYAALTHCLFPHSPSPDRWPLMGVAQSPGQKGSQAGPPQDAIWCQGGERKREGGGRLSPLPRFWMGSPKSLSFQSPVPQVDTGQGRAGQTQATARVQGNLMTAVFSCRFPSCLGAGGSVGWWGRGGGRGKRRREVNRRPQREPVPCVQRTPAASGPRWVAVCVQKKPGGEGREGRVSTHFSAVIHPPRFSRPSSPLPSGVRGWEGDVHEAPTPKYASPV